MSVKRFPIRVAVVILGAALLVSSTAGAQGNGRGARTVVRGVRPPSAVTAPTSRTVRRSTAPRLQRSPSIGRPSAAQSPRSRSGQSPYALADVLESLGRSARDRGWDTYGSRDGYYGGRDNGDRAYAEAFRDVGIANALVSLVGVLANAQVNSAPVQYQPVQPSGHYERRQVVIKEGYYEDSQVWVPEYRVENTQDIVVGHYEVRRRWVPPVYGYQDVWVP